MSETLEMSRSREQSSTKAEVRHDKSRIVIVGGGFGGIAAAKALRHCDAEVLVIDRRNHHIFQPLLYQVATAVLAPSEVAAPIRQLEASKRMFPCSWLKLSASIWDPDPLTPIVRASELRK
jgi:NADH dehydrogenase